MRILINGISYDLQELLTNCMGVYDVQINLDDLNLGEELCLMVTRNGVRKDAILYVNSQIDNGDGDGVKINGTVAMFDEIKIAGIIDSDGIVDSKLEDPEKPGYKFIAVPK